MAACDPAHLTLVDQSEYGLFRLQQQLRENLGYQLSATRTQFEGWIAEELGRIETCIDELLSSTGVPACAVDRVFLTGGTSFVPAVRRIFASRFGEAALRTGEEFTSVARGLAVSHHGRRTVR